MADFCRDCSIKMFGKDTMDLAGLTSLCDTMNNRYAYVICEGCGYVLVDHNGIVVRKFDGPDSLGTKNGDK